MKILTGIDVPFQPFGGSLICCNDWYSNLPDGVEVRFLTLPPPPGQTKWWDMQDVVMMDIVKRRGEAEFARYIEELRVAVEAQVAEYQPDILHCQHLNYGLSRVFAELDTDIPRIGICHGTDVQIATQLPFFKRNLEIICDAMDQLVFPNANMANDFFAVYGKPKKHVINPLGIPDSFYRPAARPIAFDGQGTLRVLYAGRLVSWKGADIAVRAFDKVAHPMHLTIIGNEDETGYKAKMLDYVAAHGLKDVVAFEDQLPRQTLLKRFDDFDVIVFPSTRIEAFSLTVVEAQLSGLPVVAADAGGIANTLGDGGLLLPQSTPGQLARALDHIYEHPALLPELQRKGMANAEKYRLSRSRDALFDLSRQLAT